jgi:ribonuclease BN (tRNA processing enzyme)
VRGVGTLLHEVWLTDEEAERDDAGRTGHSAAGAVAELAREAGVGRLVPVHHHPRRTAADLDALAGALARSAGCPVELPVEGRAIELG